jgi:lysozyme
MQASDRLARPRLCSLSHNVDNGLSLLYSLPAGFSPAHEASVKEDKTMQMSENGLELLKQWEGFELKVYKDSAGLLTIGVGHLLTKSELSSGKIVINGVTVKYANGLTEQQALDLLSQDVQPAEQTVNTNVKVPLNQNQFDALVSFTFNVGGGAFKSSTLLKVLNQKQYTEVPTQLLRWTRAGGKVVQGLLNRRQNEIKLWNDQI